MKKTRKNLNLQRSQPAIDIFLGDKQHGSQIERGKYLNMYNLKKQVGASFRYTTAERTILKWATFVIGISQTDGDLLQRNTLELFQIFYPFNLNPEYMAYWWNNFSEKAFQANTKNKPFYRELQSFPDLYVWLMWSQAGLITATMAHYRIDAQWFNQIRQALQGLLSNKA